MHDIKTRDVLLSDILPIIKEVIKEHLEKILEDRKIYKRSDPDIDEYEYYFSEDNEFFDDEVRITDFIEYIEDDIRVKSYKLLDRNLPNESVILKVEHYNELELKIRQIFSVIGTLNQTLCMVDDIREINALKDEIKRLKESKPSQ
jgi:hypothetical protein